MGKIGIEQSKRELDYARHQLNSLIALFSYDKADAMIKMNRTRALSSIDCIIEVMQDAKEYIEKVLVE